MPSRLTQTAVVNSYLLPSLRGVVKDVVDTCHFCQHSAITERVSQSCQPWGQLRGEIYNIKVLDFIGSAVSYCIHCSQ